MRRPTSANTHLHRATAGQWRLAALAAALLLVSAAIAQSGRVQPAPFQQPGMLP